MGKPTHNHPPHITFEPAPPPAHDVAMKALLRLAKFVDTTVTKDDDLLAQLEADFSSGSLTRTSHAAERILHRAETATWGGGA